MRRGQRSMLELLQYIGPHKVMWASDYPHPESTLGYTAQTIRDIFDATDEPGRFVLPAGRAVEPPAHVTLSRP